MHALTHTRIWMHRHACCHAHTHTHPFMGTAQGVSLPLKLNKCYRHLTPDDNPESDRTRNNERVATDQNFTRIQIKGKRESTKKRPRDKIILPAADTKVAKQVNFYEMNSLLFAKTQSTWIRSHRNIFYLLLLGQQCTVWNTTVTAVASQSGGHGFELYREPGFFPSTFINSFPSLQRRVSLINSP